MANTWTMHDGKRITMTYDQVGVGEKAPEWAQQEWRVTLRRDGRRMTLPYYGGGSASDPTADDVVECLASDASACEVSFGEWCDDFGYGSGQIAEAERIYKASRRIGARFRKFLA